MKAFIKCKYIIDLLSSLHISKAWDLLLKHVFAGLIQKNKWEVYLESESLFPSTLFSISQGCNYKASTAGHHVVFVSWVWTFPWALEITSTVILTKVHSTPTVLTTFLLSASVQIPTNSYLQFIPSRVHQSLEKQIMPDLLWLFRCIYIMLKFCT